ncbi:HD-GYP domain-containing protein [Planctobacterium marinum]|uniref:HD-GYP domain-containing protein n=1 Tax=Planctobacterium marinum TaxID=1631968 RepID=UPI001E362CDB|nr:HD-GYP domain-containing protein [Planctobacterium marinum]MCC2606369.1 HD-GYP domain-containing protein [Planctobacterium marinum]
MNKLVVVPIDKLAVGMFVEAVHQQDGDLKIKTQGKVTTENAISILKTKGIISLIVDMERSDVARDTERDVDTDTNETERAEHVRGSVSLEDELTQASALYEEAKKLQKKLLHSIQAGLPVNFQPIKDVSEKFVNSLDRNPNALLCMIHLRQKDAYLLEHSLNVGILMGAFAQYLELDNDVVSELALAGMLHDIGKIEIPDQILHKPGKLTDEEMDVMKGHVVKGLEVLKKMEGISKRLFHVVAQHHERLDGSGYPMGLNDSDINIYGRMIAIVDGYDAMTADRCYRKGMPPNQALKILLKCSETELDKALVNKFIKYIGVHPVGSLVKLDSEKLSLVTEHNENAPLSPKVKTFFSFRSNHFVAPKDVNLADKHCREKIASAVRAEDIKINYRKFFHEQIVLSK